MTQTKPEPTRLVEDVKKVTPMDRLGPDFKRIFEARVQADRNGHTGDVVPRSGEFET